jgi:hypothetical protein
MKRGCFLIPLILYIVMISEIYAYFDPVWIGPGFQHMNFYVLSASIQNVDLGAGDEIGVFDGEYCVGAIVLSSPISEYPNGIVPIVASMNDPTTPQIDGYTAGNPSSFKIWDSQAQIEYSEPDLIVTYQSGNPIFAVGATSAVHLSVDEINTVPEDVIITIEDGFLIICWMIVPEIDDYIVEASTSYGGDYHVISDEMGIFGFCTERGYWSVLLQELQERIMFFRVRSLLD